MFVALDVARIRNCVAASSSTASNFVLITNGLLWIPFGFPSKILAHVLYMYSGSNAHCIVGYQPPLF